MAAALRILRRRRSQLGARAGRAPPSPRRFSPAWSSGFMLRTGTSGKQRTCSACASRGIRTSEISCSTMTSGRRASSRCATAFNAQAAMRNRRPNVDWRPRRIVQEPGAFIMPIGPKFSGITESVHFLLETVGEDVIRSSTRLFYKWRAVEKLAEGKTVEEGLLLAERFAATTAFAHGLAFCQGVESVCSVQVPPRARSAAGILGRARAAAAARRRDPGNLRIHSPGGCHQPGGTPRGGTAAPVGRTDRSSLPVRPARPGRVAVRSVDRCLPRDARAVSRTSSSG